MSEAGRTFSPKLPLGALHTGKGGESEREGMLVALVLCQAHLPRITYVYPTWTHRLMQDALRFVELAKAEVCVGKRE